MSSRQQDRNHFVSQLLLKRFVRKGGQRRNSVLVFAKERAGEGLREELIEETFQYQGIFDKDVEELCQCIESKGAEALKKLTKCIRGKKPLDLTESDRDDLNMFTTSLVVRSMPLLHDSTQGTLFSGGVENFLFGKIGERDAEAKGKITHEVVNDIIREMMKRRFPHRRLRVKFSEREDLQLATGSIPFVRMMERDPNRCWSRNTLMGKSPGGILLPKSQKDSDLSGLTVRSPYSEEECWIIRMWVPIHRQIAVRPSEGEVDVMEPSDEEFAQAINLGTYYTSPEIIVQSEAHLKRIQEIRPTAWTPNAPVKYLPIPF